MRRSLAVPRGEEESDSLIINNRLDGNGTGRRPLLSRHREETTTDDDDDDSRRSVDNDGGGVSLADLTECSSVNPHKIRHGSNRNNNRGGGGGVYTNDKRVGSSGNNRSNRSGKRRSNRSDRDGERMRVDRMDAVGRDLDRGNDDRVESSSSSSRYRRRHHREQQEEEEEEEEDDDDETNNKDGTSYISRGLSHSRHSSSRSRRRTTTNARGGYTSANNTSNEGIFGFLGGSGRGGGPMGIVFGVFEGVNLKTVLMCVLAMFMVVKMGRPPPEYHHHHGSGGVGGGSSSGGDSTANHWDYDERKDGVGGDIEGDSVGGASFRGAAILSIEDNNGSEEGEEDGGSINDFMNKRGASDGGIDFADDGVNSSVDGGGGGGGSAVVGSVDYGNQLQVNQQAFQQPPPPPPLLNQYGQPLDQFQQYQQQPVAGGMYGAASDGQSQELAYEQQQQFQQQTQQHQQYGQPLQLQTQQSQYSSVQQYPPQTQQGRYTDPNANGAVGVGGYGVGQTSSYNQQEQQQIPPPPPPIDSQSVEIQPPPLLDQSTQQEVDQAPEVQTQQTQQVQIPGLPAVPLLPQDPPAEGAIDLEELNNFKDSWDPHSTTDIPMFWHIPKAGGSSIKDAMGGCHRFVQATEFGVTDGHISDPTVQIVYPKIPGGDPDTDRSPFVNIDSTTVAGIQRAKELGFADAHLAQVVVSPFVFETNDLFTPTAQGRLFSVFRHPIDRAISMFYYIQVADWEPSYKPELKEWTLEQYAQSDIVENNWMTRQLSNQLGGELTEVNLKKAMEVVRRKFMVGLMTEIEPTMSRFEKFFRWTFRVNPPNQDACRDRLMSGGSNSNKANKKPLPTEGEPAWDLLAHQNNFDLQLYNYIEQLFVEQEAFVAGLPDNFRMVDATCCKCDPPTFPPEGFTCPESVKNGSRRLRR